MGVVSTRMPGNNKGFFAKDQIWSSGCEEALPKVLGGNSAGAKVAGARNLDRRKEGEGRNRADSSRFRKDSQYFQNFPRHLGHCFYEGTDQSDSCSRPPCALLHGSTHELEPHFYNGIL